MYENTTIDKLELSISEAYMAGYVLGDAYYAPRNDRSGNKMVLVVHDDDIMNVQHHLNVMGVAVNFSRHPTCEVVQRGVVKVRDQGFAERMGVVPGTSRTKTFSYTRLESMGLQREFLAGLLDADGSVTIKKYTRQVSHQVLLVSTQSESIADAVYKMGSRLGLDLHLGVQKPRKGGVSRYVRVRAASIEKLKDWPLGPKKKGALTAVLRYLETGGI